MTNSAESDKEYDITAQSDYFILNKNLSLSTSATRKYILMGNSSNLESNNGVMTINSPTGNLTFCNGN